MKLYFLRPPGARPEREFLARCLQCGQCALVCPYGSIVLTEGFNLLVSGTPQVFPGKVPCYLCMRCPPACPSGALKPLALEEVRMGRAQLDRSTCYTWQETLICRSCFERCPLKGRAIELERGMYPVITELCAGCGLCEHVCPKNSITTVPLRLL